MIDKPLYSSIGEVVHCRRKRVLSGYFIPAGIKATKKDAT
jgi:hypothetical protein